MKKTSLISVIVASYGNASYIEQTIKSVINQSYRNWELIITDDASPDNSNEIISKFISNPKIKLFKHAQNKGVGAAFSTCIKHASGSIIAMLGADDALKEDALHKLSERYKQHPEAAMIIGALELTDRFLSPVCKVLQHNSTTTPTNILFQQGTIGWDTFRRSYYDQTSGFNPNLPKAVDVDLYYKMEEVGDLVFIQDALYLYRQNESGVSQGSNGMRAFQYNRLCMIEAYDRRKSNKSIDNISLSQKRRILYAYNFQEAVFQIKNSSKACLFHLIKALQYNPGIIFRKHTFSIIFKLIFK